jgi:hypothetical protein
MESKRAASKYVMPWTKVAGSHSAAKPAIHDQDQCQGQACGPRLLPVKTKPKTDCPLPANSGNSNWPTTPGLQVASLCYISLPNARDAMTKTVPCARPNKAAMRFLSPQL